MRTDILRSFAVLFGFQFAGDLVSRVAGIPIPGNVIGMVLLAAALAVGAVRPAWIEPAADLLLENLAFFFIPAGVGIMAFAGLLAREWLPISLSIVVSMLVVLFVTGRVFQLFCRKNDE